MQNVLITGGAGYRTKPGFGMLIRPITGLAQTLRWYLDHEAWWRDVTSGAYKARIDKNYGYRIAV